VAVEEQTAAVKELSWLIWKVRHGWNDLLSPWLNPVQIKRKGLLSYCWCDVVASLAPLICCARSGGGVGQISLWFAGSCQGKLQFANGDGWIAMLELL
jgi:hypothetical protein